MSTSNPCSRTYTFTCDGDGYGNCFKKLYQEKVMNPLLEINSEIDELQTWLDSIIQRLKKIQEIAGNDIEIRIERIIGPNK